MSRLDRLPCPGRPLEVARTVAAPAAAVWAVLIDTGCWGEWGPSVSGAQIDGGGDRIGPGSTGRVRTTVGVSLPFRVTAWEPGRSWSWSVGGVPATTHRVEPDGPDACRLVFGVPWWAPPYLAVCALALGRIERLALA
jgi:hypothetical protein